MDNIALIKELEKVAGPVHLLNFERNFLYSSTTTTVNNPLYTDNKFRKQVLDTLYQKDNLILLSKSQNYAGLLFHNGDYLLLGPIDFSKLEKNSAINVVINAVNSLLKTYNFVSKSLTNDNNLPIDNQDLNDFLKDLDKNYRQQIQKLDLVGSQEPHNTYAYEYKLVEAIGTGDVDKALRALRAPMHGKEGMMGFTPLRQAKNSVVVNATVCARAAIKANVRVEAAYTLADYFILAAELCKTVEDAKKVREQCTAGFTKLVNENIKTHLQSHHALVNKVLEEIEHSILRKVNLEDLIECTGKNKDYIQRLFKKDIGMSIMEYLRKRRIDTACELLVSTNHTISDLAATLNFSSTSHFARCFKAFTKVSPLEYKNKYFSKTNL